MDGYPAETVENRSVDGDVVKLSSVAIQSSGGWARGGGAQKFSTIADWPGTRCTGETAAILSLMESGFYTLVPSAVSSLVSFLMCRGFWAVNTKQFRVFLENY